MSNHLVALAVLTVSCVPADPPAELPAETTPSTTGTVVGAPDFDEICASQWDCSSAPCDVPELAVYTDAYLRYLSETNAIAMTELESVVSAGPLSSDLSQRMFFESGWLKVSWKALLPEATAATPIEVDLVDLFREEGVTAPNFRPGMEILPWSEVKAGIEACEEEYGVSFDLDASMWCNTNNDPSYILFDDTIYDAPEFPGFTNVKLRLTIVGENPRVSCMLDDGGPSR